MEQAEASSDTDERLPKRREPPPEAQPTPTAKPSRSERSPPQRVPGLTGPRGMRLGGVMSRRLSGGGSVVATSRAEYPRKPTRRLSGGGVNVTFSAKGLAKSLN